MSATGASHNYSGTTAACFCTHCAIDMREHGFSIDDWPSLCRKVMTADILVIGTPIWLGEESSVCRRTIERLYGESGKLNDKGQYIYYGRVGGCVVTGNEDGVKHCAERVIRAAASGLYHSAAGGCRLDRRGRPRAFVRRRGIGRPTKRRHAA
jgi:multimeric flavodoxin WrbA